MAYLYILGTILLTVFAQLILKYRIMRHGVLPEPLYDKFIFLLKLFLDPFILLGFFSAFIAALCWMAALSKFDLTHAYPFMGCTFILVLVLSGILFNEAITLFKCIGVLLVVLGVIVASQG